MKLNNKIGTLTLGFALAAMTSCAVHDPFADNMEIGQTLPTVSWELGSTVCKAGSDVSFKGKYYTSAERTIDRSEVWAAISRSETAAATVKLTSALSYTKTITVNDTVRSSQKVQSYAHSLATWDGYEFVLASTFPTSQTLKPVSWSEPGVWDQEKFDTYYPSTFQDEFKATVVNYLTKDSIYYNDLRNVYIKYDFTADQFAALNAKYNVTFPTETATDKKSDLWFTDQSVIDHYYYNTVAGGVTTSHEIAKEADAPQGVKVLPVYKSSAWVFCRYSDDTGGAIMSIRQQYKAYMKSLMELISFTDWIYNTADKVYSVTFNRSYKLIPTYKVFDTEGKVGTDTDDKSIDLN